MVKRTTGLYGMTKQALEKYRCLVGARPYIHFVSRFKAVDINMEEDLKIAEHIENSFWHYAV